MRTGILNLLRNQSAGRVREGQILRRSQRYALGTHQNAPPFGVLYAAVDLRNQRSPTTRPPFEVPHRLFGAASGDMRNQRSAEEIEEDPEEDPGEVEDIIEYVHNTLVGLFKTAGSVGLFGKLWERLQMTRFFSKGYDQGPRIFKLCMFARPGRELSIHSLCIQNERDKMYSAPRSREDYTEKDMDPVLLKKLEKFWVNYEENRTNFAFRELMWDRHGRKSGLSVVDYFTITMDLFEKFNDIDFNALGDKIVAVDIAVKVMDYMEEKYGNPRVFASPGIVCSPENSGLFKELRYTFEGEFPYWPFRYRTERIYINCDSKTPIIW